VSVPMTSRTSHRNRPWRNLDFRTARRKDPEPGAFFSRHCCPDSGWHPGASKMPMTLPVLREASFRSAGQLVVLQEILQRGFVMVIEFRGIETSGLLFDDMPGEFEHVLGDLDVLDAVEVDRARGRCPSRRRRPRRAVCAARPLPGACPSARRELEAARSPSR
jgi:hypothetical protein